MFVPRGSKMRSPVGCVSTPVQRRLLTQYGPSGLSRGATSGYKPPLPPRVAEDAPSLPRLTQFEHSPVCPGRTNYELIFRVIIRSPGPNQFAIFFGQQSTRSQRK